MPNIFDTFPTLKKGFAPLSPQMLALKEKQDLLQKLEMQLLKDTPELNQEYRRQVIQEVILKQKQTSCCFKYLDHRSMSSMGALPELNLQGSDRHQEHLIRIYVTQLQMDQIHIPEEEKISSLRQIKNQWAQKDSYMTKTQQDLLTSEKQEQEQEQEQELINLQKHQLYGQNLLNQQLLMDEKLLEKNGWSELMVLLSNKPPKQNEPQKQLPQLKELLDQCLKKPDIVQGSVLKNFLMCRSEGLQRKQQQQLDHKPDLQQLDHELQQRDNQRLQELDHELQQLNHELLQLLNHEQPNQFLIQLSKLQPRDQQLQLRGLKKMLKLQEVQLMQQELQRAHPELQLKPLELRLTLQDLLRLESLMLYQQKERSEELRQKLKEHHEWLEQRQDLQQLRKLPELPLWPRNLNQRTEKAQLQQKQEQLQKEQEQLRQKQEQLHSHWLRLLKEDDEWRVGGFGLSQMELEPTLMLLQDRQQQWLQEWQLELEQKQEETWGEMFELQLKLQELPQQLRPDQFHEYHARQQQQQQLDQQQQEQLEPTDPDNGQSFDLSPEDAANSNDQQSCAFSETLATAIVEITGVVQHSDDPAPSIL